MAAICTPAGLIQEYPCLACLSETELLAVMIIAANELIASYNLPEELDALMQDSACFACLSDKQKLQAGASALAQKAYERNGKTMEEIRDEIKCLLCSPPGNLKAALLLILCNLTNGFTAPQ